jgi:hypothetical protein
LAPIPGVTRHGLPLTVRMQRSNGPCSKRSATARPRAPAPRAAGRAAKPREHDPLGGRLFPERGDVEIAGMMSPHPEVGGDFFDAFFVDDRHLFLCVGDVSSLGFRRLCSWRARWN